MRVAPSASLRRLQQQLTDRLRRQLASQTLTATVDSTQSATTNYDHAKPFSAIPGPRGLPLFGNLLDYRFGGRYKVTEYHKALVDRCKAYGPLVKERFADRRVLHVFDPEDVKTVLNADGKVPHINPLQETTLLYRSMRNLSLGLGNMNGDDWYRLRTAVQQLMMRPKKVANFLPLAEQAAREFVAEIEKRRDAKTGEVANFRNLVLRWTLESAGRIIFEKRLNALTSAEDAPDSTTQLMIDANREIFLLSGLLKFSLPLYRFLPTPKWRRLVKAEDYFYGHATALVNEAIDKIRALIDAKKLDGDQFDFLSYLLARSELDQKDVTIIALSLFGDGLNTTSPAFIYNLYCLATNPAVQDKLANEIRESIPDLSAPITSEHVAKLPYLKACVKECFRLFPVGTEISRIVQKNLVLSGYQVPAGTAVDLSPEVHLHDPAYFDDPEEFRPERFLRSARESTDDSTVGHPFLLLPFGHGPRMCAGRRFAEQDLYLALSLVVRQFRVSYLGDAPLEQELKTLLVPKGSTQFAFVDRR